MMSVGSAREAGEVSNLPRILEFNSAYGPPKFCDDPEKASNW